MAYTCRPWAADCYLLATLFIILLMPQRLTRQSMQVRRKAAELRPLDPRARRVTINSAALGVLKSFYVSLPPGYSSAGNMQQRYPVLYLFRGHEHEWIHRFQD